MLRVNSTAIGTSQALITEGLARGQRYFTTLQINIHPR